MRQSADLRGAQACVVAMLGAALSWVVVGCGGSGSGDGFGSGDSGGGGTPDGTTAALDAGHPLLGAGDAAPDAAGGNTAKDAGNGPAHPDAGAPLDATPDAAVALSDASDATTTLPDASEIPDAFTVHEAAPPHDAASNLIPIVYGQSSGTLYSVNPVTKAVTVVGNFPGCDPSGVIDIALDKDSNMYATTFDGVYTVDAATSACKLLAFGSYPNSLSFVPAGTVDPSVEALVGYNGSTYVRINTTTGALTTVGSLGGSTYSSSGDIVSVIGGGTYLTVKGGTDCTSNDCLVSVNPATGALVTNYGSVGHSQVFGLAFWAGDVYGFDSAGGLFEVTFPDAGGLGVTNIPIPNAPSGLSFFGAGSTTSAPKR